MRIFNGLILLAAAMLVAGCYKSLSPDASEAFKARTEPFSVAVYPVNVIRPPGILEPDIGLAEKVVAFL